MGVSSPPVEDRLRLQAKSVSIPIQQFACKLRADIVHPEIPAFAVRAISCTCLLDKLITPAQHHGCPLGYLRITVVQELHHFRHRAVGQRPQRLYIDFLMQTAAIGPDIIPATTVSTSAYSIAASTAQPSSKLTFI